MIRPVGVVAILFALAGAAPLAAAEPDPWSCPTWISIAERAYGIPPQLLQAIGRVEIGDALVRGKAGSWTLNVGGRAVSPASLTEAMDTIILAPTRSIDVGCLQINLRAHGPTVGAEGWLLYPKYNAAYGAWYLASLSRSLGGWGPAVAACHAGSHAGSGWAYCRRVAAAYAELTETSDAAVSLACR